MAEQDRQRSAEEVDRAVVEIMQEADFLEEKLENAYDRIEVLESALRDAGEEVPE